MTVELFLVQFRGALIVTITGCVLIAFFSLIFNFSLRDINKRKVTFKLYNQVNAKRSIINILGVIFGIGGSLFGASRCMSNSSSDSSMWK